MNLRQCIEKGFLESIEPDVELSQKEKNESKYDLDRAVKAYEDGNYK